MSETREMVTATYRQRAVSRTAAKSDDGRGGVHQVRFYSDSGQPRFDYGSVLLRCFGSYAD
ncbi:hypothetical protein HanXRQr2_Chr13g0585001 [Helianthus annuus]|uniref:Uncharacterized protein n=1 Tax=Helianthus annuus TaxID=4232 RepID=A0A9K3HC73_HELAN|nr:hypothetical protein HanXRQr2_Chr13g0585001 [Helianthus annuus]